MRASGEGLKLEECKVGKAEVRLGTTPAEARLKQHDGFAHAVGVLPHVPAVKAHRKEDCAQPRDLPASVRTPTLGRPILRLTSGQLLRIGGLLGT